MPLDSVRSCFSLQPGLTVCPAVPDPGPPPLHPHPIQLPSFPSFPLLIPHSSHLPSLGAQSTPLWSCQKASGPFSRFPQHRQLRALTASFPGLQCRSFLQGALTITI